MSEESRLTDIEKALKELKEIKEQKVIVPETVVVKEKTFNFFNITLLVIIASLSAALIFNSLDKDKDDDKDDDVVVVNIVEKTKEMENKYSYNKSVVFKKAAELIDQEKFATQDQMKNNIQAMIEKARESTLGVLDQDDTDFFSQINDLKTDKEKIKKYFLEKSEGFLGASK